MRGTLVLVCARKYFSRISHYARRVRGGETIVVCDRNKPFGELRPLQEANSGTGRTRPLGMDRGKVQLSEDWDSPSTNAQIVSLFGLDDRKKGEKGE